MAAIADGGGGGWSQFQRQKTVRSSLIMILLYDFSHSMPQLPRFISHEVGIKNNRCFIHKIYNE
jgi:hypothetical protein